MKNLRSYFLALFPILVVGIHAVEGAEPPSSPEVAATIQPYLDQHKLAGVIGIIADRDGKVHYKNLMGYADVEAKQPISEDNVFWVASMTKMFAGASIMMLVDEGKLSLDDPVDKFFPELSKQMGVRPESGGEREPLVRPVTIRHLLSHTHGLDGKPKQSGTSDRLPLKDRAEAYLSVSKRQPGVQFEYGNKGMDVAARIVEMVSGMPYETFLQQRFFDPLGMTETTFFPSDEMVSRLAGAYGPSSDGESYSRGRIGFLSEPLSDRTHRYPEAGGGLFSTTHDIFQYGQMLANNGELNGHRYLSPEAMDELRKKQTGDSPVNYSLGYHLRNGMFGHDGALGTNLSVDPKTGLIAIFMVQCTSGDQWKARDQFLETVRKVFTEIQQLCPQLVHVARRP